MLLEVIADKTGYPIETLELDMRLDADLGIDSIKRVEILSALQERLPDAPAVKADDLGTLQTLRQIVGFLGGATVGGGSASDVQPRPSRTQGVPPTPVGERIRLPQSSAGPEQPSEFAAVLLEVVADKTGYPVETLELSMRLDADLGIDSIKRVEILSALQERLPDAPLVQSDDMGTLVTLGDIVGFFEGRPAVVAPAALEVEKPAVGERIRHPQSGSGPPDNPMRACRLRNRRSMFGGWSLCRLRMANGGNRSNLHTPGCMSPMTAAAWRRPWSRRWASATSPRK